MARLQGKIEYNVSPYQDILDSELDKAEKARLIQERGEEINKQIDSDLMKDLIKNYAGAAIQIGSAAIPFTGGGRLAVEGAKLLKPMVGKAIANTIAKGTIAGAKSGAVEGFGRGLMEDENPLLTAAYDSVLGTLLGAGAGAIEGKITQKMAQKALKDADKTTLDKYYDAYIADLTNKTNAMAEYRAAKEGFEKGGKSTEFNTPNTETDAFKKWYGKSKTVDESGKPLTLSHGSVNTFDTFDKDLASPESDLGAAFYFTNSASDVDANYYGGGPDFDNKVARLAERLSDEEDIAYDIAKERAREELMGDPSKIDAYLKMENPLYIGKNETQLFDYDTYRQKAIDQYGLNPDDFDDIDAFEDEVQASIDNILYDEPYELTNNLYDILDSNDVEKVQGLITDIFYNGGASFENLKSKLNDLYLANPETGDLVGNEVARRIVENLGYDGIIDSTVSKKFNMNLNPDTTHYVVFNPTQIKSVNNQGTFDINDPNIYKALLGGYALQSILNNQKTDTNTH